MCTYNEIRKKYDIFIANNLYDMKEIDMKQTIIKFI